MTNPTNFLASDAPQTGHEFIEMHGISKRFVLGGASLLGGVGTVSGTVLGIILLATLQNGLTLLGVSSYSFGFVTGLVILMSVSATAYAAKHQQKQRVRHAN